MCVHSRRACCSVPSALRTSCSSCSCLSCSKPSLSVCWKCWTCVHRGVCVGSHTQAAAAAALVCRDSSGQGTSQATQPPPIAASRQALVASTCSHAAEIRDNPFYLSLQLKLCALCVLDCRCAGRQLRLKCFGVQCCCCCLLRLHVYHLLQPLRLLQLRLQSGKVRKDVDRRGRRCRSDIFLDCRLLQLWNKQTEHMGGATAL